VDAFADAASFVMSIHGCLAIKTIADEDACAPPSVDISARFSRSIPSSTFVSTAAVNVSERFPELASTLSYDHVIVLFTSSYVPSPLMEGSSTIMPSGSTSTSVNPICPLLDVFAQVMVNRTFSPWAAVFLSEDFRMDSCVDGTDSMGMPEFTTGPSETKGFDK